MLNELLGTRYSVQIFTTRGTILVECEPGGTAGYRYRPLHKLDPYYFGPIDDQAQIESALRSSWIKPTPEIIERIEAAKAQVTEIANR